MLEPDTKDQNLFRNSFETKNFSAQWKMWEPLRQPVLNIVFKSISTIYDKQYTKSVLYIRMANLLRLFVYINWTLEFSK